MQEHHSSPSAEAVSFRSLVKGCAIEPRLVESFNKAYGAQLQAPIAALIEDRWPLEVSAEEEIQIGCFIVFVHEQIWVRLQRARERLDSGFQQPTS